MPERAGGAGGHPRVHQPVVAAVDGQDLGGDLGGVAPERLRAAAEILVDHAPGRAQQHVAGVAEPVLPLELGDLLGNAVRVHRVRIVVDRAEQQPHSLAGRKPGRAAQQPRPDAGDTQRREARGYQPRAQVGQRGRDKRERLDQVGPERGQPGAHGAAERVADQVHRPAVTLFDQPGHHRGLGAHRIIAIRRGRRVPVAGQVQGLAGDQAPARAARPASIRPVEPVRFVLARCRAGPVQHVHQVGPVPRRTVEAVYAQPGFGSGRRRHGTHEHLRGPDRDQPPWPVRDGRRGPHRKRRWTVHGGQPNSAAGAEGRGDIRPCWPIPRRLPERLAGNPDDQACCKPAGD